MEDLLEECTIFLIPEQLVDATQWLGANYMAIFLHELESWCLDDRAWPNDLSFEAFNHHFEVTYSSMVVDLTHGWLEKEEG